MQNTNLEALFSDVEETGLLTLYCKAVESLSKHPIIRDDKAIDMAAQLDPILARSNSVLLQRLVKRKIDPKLVVHIALRAKKYDDYVLDFLAENPDGGVVNIGCGLDPRFFRIDNGSVRYFDLDLPQVIAFKKQLLDENQRYQMIAGSLLERDWMDVLAKRRIAKWLFLAEGVFMYFNPDSIKQLVIDLQSHFPGSELVCEVVKKQWTQGILQKIGAMKMKSRFDVGETAGFHFGLDYPSEMESWQPGIKFLGSWSYLESENKKLGAMRIFRNSKYFKEMQYTVHYQLR